jgi:hypothetical protein
VKIKVVIQSCTGYEEPVAKLLASINFQKHEDDIILVKNAAVRDKVTKELFATNNATGIITTIHTPKNIWEYCSYQKVAEFMEHPDIESEYFLFLHDTCWAKSSEGFWKGIERFKEKNPLAEFPRGFCYPYEGPGSYNMGFARKGFVMKFGMQFKGHTFTKRQGIAIEHLGARYGFIPPKKDQPPAGLRGIQNLGVPIVTLGGKRNTLDAAGKHRLVAGGTKRNVVLIPLLKLYKAWHHVGEHNDHPDKP